MIWQYGTSSVVGELKVEGELLFAIVPTIPSCLTLALFILLI